MTYKYQSINYLLSNRLEAHLNKIKVYKKYRIHMYKKLKTTK